VKNIKHKTGKRKIALNSKKKELEKIRKREMGGRLIQMKRKILIKEED
jgi:hypothetical protein